MNGERTHAWVGNEVKGVTDGLEFVEEGMGVRFGRRVERVRETARGSALSIRGVVVRFDKGWNRWHVSSSSSMQCRVMA